MEVWTGRRANADIARQKGHGRAENISLNRMAVRHAEKHLENINTHTLHAARKHTLVCTDADAKTERSGECFIYIKTGMCDHIRNMQRQTINAGR